MQEMNDVQQDVTPIEEVNSQENENLQNDEQLNSENQPPKKKSGIKNFIQLVLFILLSMAGFIVQMIIEQIGARLGFVENLNETTFNFFGLPQYLGSFIVTLVAVFICKLINFILHRKVLFKARANLAFSIIMYLIFSIVLWIGSAAIKAPVQNALMNNEWWTSHITSDPKGWAVTVAVMVYSTADLIIMFFAEKFLIMNDKLFKKGKSEEQPSEETAELTEEAQAVQSQDVQVEVAADNAVENSEEAETSVIEEKIEDAKAEVEDAKEQAEEIAKENSDASNDDEIVILSQADFVAMPEEDKKVEEAHKVKEEKVEVSQNEQSEVPVLTLEEAANIAEEEVAEEEKELEKKPAAKTQTKKAAATKSTTAKKTTAKSTTAAKKTTTSKTASAKKPAEKKEGEKKTLSASSVVAPKKASTAKSTAAKKTAAKTTSAAKKTTTAKTTTAKKTAAKSETKKTEAEN